jgi:hypothetical protein
MIDDSADLSVTSLTFSGAAAATPLTGTGS